MIVKSILIYILLIVMSACTAKEAEVKNIKEQHKIKSADLRLLMRDINFTMDDSHMSELERDSNRKRNAHKLVKRLQNFSHKLDLIPKEKLGKNIGDSEMKIFKSHIRELDRNILMIDQIVQNHQLEKLYSAIKNLNRTCKSCHTHLRDSR